MTKKAVKKIKSGVVFLVGAGPGDPDLISVKGLGLIKKADTIIYDHLASKKLLSFAKKTTKIIYVGKQDSRHTYKQDEINKILVLHAKNNKMVVRLKGGDPFVFGRGGEEALFLKKNNLKFEIVPGVTSAIAAPAYAGIPVTHRQYTSSVTIITGHQSTNRKKYLPLDWKNIAENRGTLVFLMGVHNLDEIVRQLVLNGKRPTTPIAIVRWGTHSEQKTVTGSLSNIVQKVRDAKLTPPAVIVVGDVVGLRQKLKWFE